MFCLASYDHVSTESEFEDLTEQLFRDSEPNIFQYVKVNLQSSTSSWSRSDDADLPWVEFVNVLSFYIFR